MPISSFLRLRAGKSPREADLCSPKFTLFLPVMSGRDLPPSGKSTV